MTLLVRPARQLGRPFARAAVVATGVVMACLAGSEPASADPARPTNYQSTVTAISPAADGVDVNIIGGDAYVVLQAAAGVTVEVAGYDGEPYLRFDADGTVRVNDRSPARWLNDERFGVPGTEIPASVDPEAPPQWRIVASDGKYAWHDHRIHFMSPQLPRDIDVTIRQQQRVFEWSIPMIIDGAPVEVHGELFWLPPPPAGAVVAQAGAAVILVVGLIGFAGWWPAVAAVTLVALTIGVGGGVGLPAGADWDVAQLVLPTVALVLGGGGWLMRRRADKLPVPPMVVALLPVVPMGVWAVVLAPALVQPIVPGAVAAGLVRSGTVAAAMIVVAGMALTMNPAWRHHLEAAIRQ
ncbi:MAG: hypothetical protein WD576_02510 [Nitriliruptoraceae bacterium]